MLCDLRLCIISLLSFSLLSLTEIPPERENSTTQSAPSSSKLSARQTSQEPPASPPHGSACKSIRVRKEWRTLSHDEQADYIRSVKSLARLPSKLLGSSYRRWDDFEYVHSQLRGRIHVRPLFLPWHRNLARIYEKVLQDECNLKGTLPYWDWTLDYKNITQSPIWSSDTAIGFGSNGSFFGPGSDPANLDAGVVMDGAFAKFPIYYPGRMMLQRNFGLKAPYAIPGYYLGNQWFGPNNLAIIASQTNFTSFAMKLEGNYKLAGGITLPGPHSIIHSVLGGDMPDLAYSANDVAYILSSSLSNRSNLDQMAIAGSGTTDVRISSSRWLRGQLGRGARLHGPFPKDQDPRGYGHAQRTFVLSL